MARRRRNQGGGLDAWPGYVDALSTLLMVITFVLLVFEGKMRALFSLLFGASLLLFIERAEAAFDRADAERLEDELRSKRAR